MTTDAQRRLLKAKASERELGKWLIEHDGIDPKWAPGNGIVTAAGRVGHITELQLDSISRSYGAENKQMLVGSTLWGFWKKVVARAWEQGKQPLLRWEPTNEDRFIEGKRVPNLHVITEERHAELLWYERQFIERQERATARAGSVRSYSKEEQVRRSKGRPKAK